MLKSFLIKILSSMLRSLSKRVSVETVKKVVNSLSHSTTITDRIKRILRAMLKIIKQK